MPTSAARPKAKTLVAGRVVQYTVRRSDRAKRAGLRIDHSNGLVVVLPRRAPLSDVPRLLKAHAEWIDREVDRYDVRLGPRRRGLAAGSEILILGRPRRLCLAPLPDGQQRARVRLVDGRIEAELPPSALLDPRPILERWLRAEARRHLTLRVPALAAEIGLAPSRIVVGERKSRWGSCSNGGTLSFCYRLLMAPPEVIDAVIVHELCHLRHLNHGARFHRLLNLACPEHEALFGWLREHEGELRI